jgi:hypothetical protein
MAYCPPGTYDNDYSGLRTDKDLVCVDCALGKYCPIWGMTDTDLDSGYTCPEGYVCTTAVQYSSLLTNTSIKFCPEGKFCGEGADSA